MSGWRWSMFRSAISTRRPRARLNQVPTRLALPQAEVDLVIEAGRRAIRTNPSVRDALAHVQRKAGVGSAHAW